MNEDRIADAIDQFRHDLVRGGISQSIQEEVAVRLGQIVDALSELHSAIYQTTAEEDGKFVQIATDENGIIALDNTGRVWSFNSAAGWNPLSTNRSGEPK